MSDTRASHPDPAAQEPVKPAFVDLLIKSVFEPGANPAVVMAMNVSFFALILVLVALAFLTSWNGHVLLLLGLTSALWAAMVWFVVELTKIQLRPDNMPVTDPLDPRAQPGALQRAETKKDR